MSFQATAGSEDFTGCTALILLHPQTAETLSAAILEPEADDWEKVEYPSVELWVALRDVLFRKYQRRRVPFKFVERVDAILTDLGVDVTKSESGAKTDEDDD